MSHQQQRHSFVRRTHLLEESAVRTSEAHGREASVHVSQADVVDRTLGFRIRVVLASLLVVARESRLGMRVDVDVEGVGGAILTGTRSPFLMYREDCVNS